MNDNILTKTLDTSLEKDLRFLNEMNDEITEITDKSQIINKANQHATSIANFTFREIIYASFFECCKNFNIYPLSVFYLKEKRNLSLEDALEIILTNKEKIIFRGKEYKSIEDCLSEYHINLPEVMIEEFKHNRNLSFEDILELYLLSKEEEFVFRGTKYSSVYDCCKKNSVDIIDLINMKRRDGKSITNIIEFLVVESEKRKEYYK